ncbi:MAG: hypothetical protein P8X63_03320 [Desulfuromonadaceae bacterium]
MKDRDKHNPKDQVQSQSADTTRRDFLRQSAYAAYATPVVLALLVDKASAGGSGSGGGTVDPPPPPST